MMSRKFLLLMICCLPLLAGWVQTPETPPEARIAYTNRSAYIFAGPSDSHREVTSVAQGTELEIIERNRIGNWLHVQRKNANAVVTLDGWVLSGYLALSADLHFSDVPVNSEIPESDRIKAKSLVEAQLYEVPVLPELNAAALQEVYVRGQWLGNHPNVITKVGDSVAANEFFLSTMINPDYQLGAYDFLADTIDFFGSSLAEDSVAARIGMTTYVIFDPLWADKDRCQANESPLACEYRLKKPSIAMIVFGPNDVRHMTDAEFDEQMRLIVDESLAAGVIPVLSTFSNDPEAPLWWQSINFNLRLATIADDYQIPLINLWAAARILPNYGLDQDRIHLKNSGFRFIKFTRGNEADFGVTLQNLLSIRMLDEIRETLDMG